MKITAYISSFLIFLITETAFAEVKDSIISEGRPAWTSTDSWYCHPDSSIYSQIRDFPIFDFATIIPSKEQTAEKLLQKKPFIEVTPKLALFLTGNDNWHKYDAKRIKGQALYLVRGVYLYSESAKIYYWNRQILIEQDCLGKTALPMKRRAVVVILPNEPTKSYATCAMDE